VPDLPGERQQQWREVFSLQRNRHSARRLVDGICSDLPRPASKGAGLLICDPSSYTAIHLLSPPQPYIRNGDCYTHACQRPIAGWHQRLAANKKTMNNAANVPIYTPVLKATGERLQIENPIFEEGFNQGRSLGNKGVLRDPATGKRYKITGKACDIPRCHCDAWAEEIGSEAA
jgi:hypothetical protein